MIRGLFTSLAKSYSALPGYEPTIERWTSPVAQSSRLLRKSRCGSFTIASRSSWHPAPTTPGLNAATSAADAKGLLKNDLNGDLQFHRVGREVNATRNGADHSGLIAFEPAICTPVTETSGRLSHSVRT